MLQAALEGNQERDMVLASRLSGSASGLIAEWVWLDPGKLGEAPFVLVDGGEALGSSRAERAVVLWRACCQRVGAHRSPQ
jgi:hypothetical protein